LREQRNGNRRADNAANRGEAQVLEAERGENVAARHHEKAGQPRPRELLNGRAGKPAGAFIESIKDAQFEAWHERPFLFLLRWLDCTPRDPRSRTD
jgi:hypothetical protein